MSSGVNVGEKPFGWHFTGPLLVASTLNPINSSMLATGLVSISTDLKVSPGTAALLVAVLYLCSAVMQPTIGKLGMLIGQRRVFIVGLTVVAAGGIVGTLAPDFDTLLLSRGLIGVGTSAAFPTAMALVRWRSDTFGTPTPTRLLGNFSIASQISTVIGLPLGGILVGIFGWRALFAINVPLAILAVIAVAVWVERDTPRARRSLREFVTILDLPGIVLFAGGVITLLLFLDNLSRPTWWLLGASVALIAALLVWERFPLSPLIDVRSLARNPALLRTYLRQIVAGLAVYTALYGLSQWMGQSAGLGSISVGVILIPLSAVSIILARIVSTRGWVRVPLIFGGLSLVAAGTILFFVTHDAAGLIILLIAVSILFGAANGLANLANQTALYVQAPAVGIGVASGLFRTFAYIGAIFSSSLIGLTFGARASDEGLHVQAIIIAALGVLLALLALDRTIPVSALRDSQKSGDKNA